MGKSVMKKLALMLAILILACPSAIADTLLDKTEITSTDLANTDLLYVVHNPAGPAVDRKMQMSTYWSLLDDVTFGKATDVSKVWTWNVNAGATNPQFTFTDGLMNVTQGTLQIGGVGLSLSTHVHDPLVLTEMAPPGAGAANTVKIYAENQPTADFTVLSYIDAGGMVRKLVRDSMITVYNNTVNPILAGKAVYHTGFQTNGYPNVRYAQADLIGTMPAIGITIESIAAGTYGRVMQVGLLENIDTSGLVAGDPVYVSAAVAGALTGTAPLVPYLRQELGSCIVSNVAGSMQVIARSLSQNESGTALDDWQVGTGIAGAKTLTFNAAVTGKLSWAPTTGAKTITLPDATGSVPLGPAAGFITFTGPSVARSFALPDAAATILTSNSLVTVPQGGSGAGTLTGMLKGNGVNPFTVATPGTDYIAPSGMTGDILAYTALNTVGVISDVAVGQVLASGGLNTLPAYTDSPTLTGLLLGDGLVGTPALRFSSDTDIGLYRIADNSLGVSIGGSVWETIGPTGFTNDVSMIAATGNEVAYTFRYTTNKAAGNDTGVLVNQTDTDSPGTSLLLDLQRNSVARFSVNNAGVVTLMDGGSIGYAVTQNLTFGSDLITGPKLIARVTQTSGTRTGFNVTPTIGIPTGNMDGTYVGMSVNPIYNQTATGGSSDGTNTDLLINRTETALAGGTQRLASFQVSAVERLGFDNNGIEYFSPLDFTGTPLAATAPSKAFRYNRTVADDAIITCPSITSGAFGWIMAGNNVEHSMIWIDNDGDVTLLNNTANVVAGANTDANLCVGTAATQEPLLIRNRLGGSYVINLVLFYD